MSGPASSANRAQSWGAVSGRAISRRSLGAAYGVLIAGMILVGCVMPFHASGWKLINTAAAMIVRAEVVHYGVAVSSYRRGWHD